MSTPEQPVTRPVHFRVITNVPAYSIRVGDQPLAFDERGEATLELPEDSEWIVYYELHDTSRGQTFELRMSERKSAVTYTVETDARSVSGFAGLDILPR